ncbi:hypothetical protein HPG69_012760 [Diceros bicornis minor]|uniref:Ig-like domain-containing protein n=1 Tax=Diceros bicornis minor TaxID=77932 RepID=A0A7J7EIK9_DICBM|nr:hypothetical protein HPG69_012760 [Diceros bicornis minor]
MVGSLDFPLPRDLFSILLLQVSMWGSDSFSVIGPSEPIVAMLGADTVLPCRVTPAMSVENTELRWFRSEFSEAVYVYQDRMEQAGEQLVDFKGSAELVKDYITEGRVAVRIHKDEGIRLTCTGKGWFPQPEVQWKDTRGEKIPSLSEDETQDDDGFFQIEASLIVRDSSKREVFCSMKNPFFGQEQVATISIPETLFPRTSPWKIAFAVTFIILEIFVGAVVFLAWKGRQEKKRAWEAKEEKVKECKAKVRRKELYQQDWRKAELYADWRKEQFKAVAVTLDPDVAHPNFIVSESGKHASLIQNVPRNCDAPTRQGQGESETIFSVLGQNCFTGGRHY